MSFLEQIAAAKAQLDELFLNIKTLLANKLTRASVADNTYTVEGKTQTHLTNTVAGVANSHEANKSNPHRVNTSHLGMLSIAQTDALLSPLMPQGQLAVSRFGDFTPAAIATSVATWTLNLTAEVPVVLTGQEGMLAPASFNLASLFSTYASKTFYVYVILDAGVLRYRVLDILVAESDSSLLIGTVTTGTSAISTVDLRKVSRLMTQYRVHTKANGTIEVFT